MKLHFKPSEHKQKAAKGAKILSRITVVTNGRSEVLKSDESQTPGNVTATKTRKVDLTKDGTSLDGESIDFNCAGLNWWFKEIGKEIAILVPRRTTKTAVSGNDDTTFDGTDYADGSFDSDVIDSLTEYMSELIALEMEFEDLIWSVVTRACSFEDATLEDEAIKLTRGKSEYNKKEAKQTKAHRLLP
jgi:hypothetical protein